MDELLAHHELKSKERVEVRRVTPPERNRRDELIALYAHKGEPWVWQITQALDGKASGLEALFYVAALGGRIVGGVAIEKTAWAGIVSHVYVKPEQRRKGVSTILMERALVDFRARGGRVLTLGTDYDSPAYQIYWRFGFRPMVERTGKMLLSDVGPFESAEFPARPTAAATMQWRHWPLASALLAIPNGRYLRSVGHHAFGPTCFEGGFLFSLQKMLNGTGQAVVLETQQPSVVGLAMLEPDPRWNESVKLLDLFLHPLFEKEAEKLLERLNLSGGKIQCHIEADAADCLQALQRFGFKEEALLRGHLRRAGQPLDVLLLCK